MESEIVMLPVNCSEAWMADTPTGRCGTILEPCPFCGGAVNLVAIDEENDWYGVECPACNGMASFTKKAEDGGWEDCGKSEVISRWNRRMYWRKKA